MSDEETPLLQDIQISLSNTDNLETEVTTTEIPTLFGYTTLKETKSIVPGKVIKEKIQTSCGCTSILKETKSTVPGELIKEKIQTSCGCTSILKETKSTVPGKVNKDKTQTCCGCTIMKETKSTVPGKEIKEKKRMCFGCTILKTFSTHMNLSEHRKEKEKITSWCGLPTSKETVLIYTDAEVPETLKTERIRTCCGCKILKETTSICINDSVPFISEETIEKVPLCCGCSMKEKYSIFHIPSLRESVITEQETLCRGCMDEISCCPRMKETLCRGCTARVTVWGGNSHKDPYDGTYCGGDDISSNIWENENAWRYKIDSDTGRHFTCTCSKEIRLDEIELENLKEGDHISRPLKCCGDYLHLCFHHAILGRKISTDADDDDDDVTFHLMGFSQSNETKAEINSEKETLRWEEMDIYKVVYEYPKYKGEQVTKNINDQKKNDIPYHVFLNNCEHLCRGSVVGDHNSIQVETLDTCCAQSVFGCLPRLVRLVLAILSTVFDEFYTNNNGWIIGLQSFALAVYFYLTLRQLVNSKFQYHSRKMCVKCLRRSFRNFLAGLAFIIFSVIGIIVDEVKNEKGVSLGLAFGTLSFWFIIELSNVCSERCRRIVTRCICFCTICSCCCCTDCYNESCGKCCKCYTCSKCCQIIMDRVDTCCCCFCIGCWSLLKRCCSSVWFCLSVLVMIRYIRTSLNRLNLKLL